MSLPLLFILMTGATYRAWRIIGEDAWPPSRWLRGHIEVAAHQWGEIAAEDDASRDARLRAWTYHELQTLIECPWCLGAWLSCAATAIVDAWFVPIPMPAMWALALSCAVGLIGSVDG